MAKLKPMARYNKTSPRYVSKYKAMLSNVKEFIIILAFLFVLCVDLEPLFDILL